MKGIRVSGSFFLILALLVPSLSLGAVADWQRGSSMDSWGPNDYSSAWFRASLKNLRATGADHVALIIPYDQTSLRSSDLRPGPHTPTDAALISAIEYAHSLSMKVMLKPHLRVAGAGDWRAWINPEDRPLWFKAYGDMLVHYAQLAENYRAEEMAIGTELINMTDPSVDPSNTENWRNMIGRVRGVFSGKLTYSANWGMNGWYDEKANLGFWDNLDYIGISVYVPLSEEWGRYSPAEIQAHWEKWETGVKALADKYNKPVLFTEVGFRSRSGALKSPPSWTKGGEYDAAEQAEGYRSLFEYWDKKPYIHGVFLWNWENDPSAGGPGDTGFTPQGKPAESVMAEWFGGVAATESEPAVTSTLIVPEAVRPGEIAVFGAELRNSGRDLPKVNVYMAVVDPSGRAILENTFTDESLLAGIPRELTVRWVPPTSTAAVLKVGVFSPDWQTSYYWKESKPFPIGDVRVPKIFLRPGIATSTPSASAAYPLRPKLTIWTPGDHAEVSGAEPLIATVEGWPIDSYHMYWQADHGAPNAMSSSEEDFPHKEAVVDVSSWYWHQDNDYLLTLYATDFYGRKIAETSIVVHVIHEESR